MGTAARFRGRLTVLTPPDRQGVAVVWVGVGDRAGGRQVKVGCDARQTVRREQLAIGVDDKALRRAVEDDPAARPGFVGGCRAGECEEQRRLGSAAPPSCPGFVVAGGTAETVPAGLGGGEGAGVGVVQNPPFLGYTRRAETAGL